VRRIRIKVILTEWTGLRVTAGRFKVSFTKRAGLRITRGRLRLGLGSDSDGLRTYVTAGIGRFSAQLQLQRIGFALPRHLDGPEHNHAVSVVLRAPGAGGLKCLGPHRRWLGGRVQAFDGGQVWHRVTQIEGRARLALILQHTSADARHPE
jgi:hypothetical protein